jgi:integrating conjugative element protein (TIGR03749 family)
MRTKLKQNRLVLCALLLLAPFITWADTAQWEAPVPERITWQKTPIALALTVGTEKRVDFPGPVKVGVPAALESVLRVQSVAGTVYLLAHPPFEATRVMVRAVDSGAIYLLDLIADNLSHPKAAIQILDPEMGKPDATAVEEQPLPTLPAYGYVALTRFAAQQLYAPARLLRDLPGVVRVPVRREAVQLVRGEGVEARPLVGWRAGDRYLTAVKLTNLTSQAVTLDPRTLRGAWLTAAFQHNRLHTAGDEADTTVVYLISARPFETSL